MDKVDDNRYNYTDELIGDETEDVGPNHMKHKVQSNMSSTSENVA